MKKLLLVIISLLLFQIVGYCETEQPAEYKPTIKVYSENNKFGLQTENEQKITQPDYQKLIPLGENGVWIAQKKGRYGLIDNDGNVIVPLKNFQVERVFAKYAKLKNISGWGLYDDNGKNIIPHKYSAIDPLFGKMFLVTKNYRYGIVNYEGKMLLNNYFEDIYMPDPNTIRLKYNGEWYEVKKLEDGNFDLSNDSEEININNNRFSITHILGTTAVASGYSVVTTTDYSLKILSSISPAYEETIDELMLSKGAEAITIFTKFSWLPKFPFIYAKKYYQNIRNPYNGPLSKIKAGLKRKM